MNNDSSPSSAARAANVASNNDAAVSDDRQPARNDGPSMTNVASLHPERRRKKKRKKKRDPGLRKKFEFVTHLLKGLDALLLAELSGLYYMECSLFRFLIRAATHALFVSPKDETFPFLMLINRMHVLLIAIPNMYCILVHILAPVPVGHEYHRGYQHGGMIIDFVGQKPPQYKLYYLLADFFVLALQFLMLSIHDEREKLRLKLGLFKPFMPPALEQPRGRTLEELDREERGEGALDETDDIELRPLTGTSVDDDASTSRGDGTERREEEGESSRRSSDDSPSVSHLADVLASGNAVIGEYHIIHSIRIAGSDVQRTAAQSLQTIGYSATFAALEARRRSVVVRAGTTQQA